MTVAKFKFAELVLSKILISDSKEGVFLSASISSSHLYNFLLFFIVFCFGTECKNFAQNDFDC